MGVRAGKYKLGSRAGKYKFGARAGKHKVGARAGKYKLGARAGEYKLRARARGWGRRPGSGSEVKQRVGSREIQTPLGIASTINYRQKSKHMFHK